MLVRLKLCAINCRFWHLWVCNGAVTHTHTHRGAAALQREVGARVRVSKQDEGRRDDNMVSDLIKHYGA